MRRPMADQLGSNREAYCDRPPGSRLANTSKKPLSVPPFVARRRSKVSTGHAGPLVSASVLTAGAGNHSERRAPVQLPPSDLDPAGHARLSYQQGRGRLQGRLRRGDLAPDPAQRADPRRRGRDRDADADGPLRARLGAVAGQVRPGVRRGAGTAPGRARSGAQAARLALAVLLRHGVPYLPVDGLRDAHSIEPWFRGPRLPKWSAAGRSGPLCSMTWRTGRTRCCCRSYSRRRGGRQAR